MKLSIWRWSHLVLAVASLIFILSASITGAILSFDPLCHSSGLHYDYQKPISTSIDYLRKEYLEVFKLEKNSYGEWIADVMTDEGDNIQILVNPNTGENLGSPIEQSAFFKDVTALHRSLFMGTIGRWLMTISAIALALITISGLFIVAQKMGGWFKFFGKLKKDNASPYYHTILGRYSFLLILLISVSGAILFLDDNWIKNESIPDLEAYLEDVEEPEVIVPLQKIKIFNMPLSEVKKIEFPFSDDVADAFIIETAKETMVVNQYTGEVHQSVVKESYVQTEELLFGIHTGHNMGYYWPIILLFGSLSILYFIYSGLTIAIKRWKAKFKNKIAAVEAEIVLFVGSENGATWAFAKCIHDEILKQGGKIYTIGMDQKLKFPKAKEVLIFTSTYGLGEAPANARKFLANHIELFTEGVSYSIVGFGSKQYDDFCKYAFDLQEQLKRTKAKEFIPIHTIDNKNAQQFISWASRYQQMKGLKNIEVKVQVNQSKTFKYKVLRNTYNSLSSEYFILELRGSSKVKSGDLISIIAPESPFARQYSIAKTDSHTITLYIRKHEMGVCSSYLSGLNEGDVIRGWIDENPAFHFRTNHAAICIGNGTGLAPFIGFLHEQKEQDIEVIWGTRTIQESNLILSHLNISKESLTLCYSREEGIEKRYASNYFIENISLYFEKIKDGAIVYICGALQMEKDIKNALSNYAIEKGIDPSSILINVKSDCY